MITREFKETVIAELAKLEEMRGVTQSQFAKQIGISASQWSRLKRGEIDGVLLDSKYITIAREQGLEIGKATQWNTVKTPAFEYINALLSACHKESISYMLVDLPDLGKSHTAKHYTKNNKGVVYMDCSQVKTKQLLVRQIARKIGVDSQGRYADVYAELCYYMNSVADNMLIILDEAGDLKYDAFLELKALWNATEDANVGWIMMGADGLQAKIDRAIACKKVGYPEIFRRYGNNYKRVSPVGSDAMEDFRKQQAMLVAQGNAPDGMDVQKLLHSNNYSLTNIKNAIKIVRGGVA